MREPQSVTPSINPELAGISHYGVRHSSVRFRLV